MRWQDYQGPFAKVVGAFGRKLERKSAVSPHYKPGAKLCTLEIKDKFRLFVDDTIDPITFLNAAFNAGIGQAQDSDPSFGQEAGGYGRRFGVNMIDQAQSEFFKDFAYPTIFSGSPLLPPGPRFVQKVLFHVPWRMWRLPTTRTAPDAQLSRMAGDQQRR